MKRFCLLVTSAMLLANGHGAHSQVASAAQSQAETALSEADAREILERTETIRLAPDISSLSAGESAAVEKLIAVGHIFQNLYEDQRHAEALAARARLQPGSDAATLYRLFRGPIATTLDNRRVPFVDVAEPPPGKNVHPLDLTKAEYEAYLAAHPESYAALTHLRSVVRRTDAASLSRDIATLKRHSVLDVLHPGLLGQLETLAESPDRNVLYAAPYSVAYADQMLRASALLFEAADAVQDDDGEFAGYLRNRARDLLSDDYESGDAVWITGNFGRLNAQIGSYETYDDELGGTRAFYSLNILIRRAEETAALREGLKDLQAVEDALPYDRQKKVRENIPVGVYDVVADFGQSRGGNTASILPNEAYITRRYGRTILLRANIMRSPRVFDAVNTAWSSVVAQEFAAHLTPDSQFNRTLWHEIGHYLGVDKTRDGRDIFVALGGDGNLFEEMKSDLVSLYAGPQLLESGYFTADQLRSHRASGIYRTLQSNKPRRTQAYQTMQLMQFNWFLDRGVLSFDQNTGRLSIDYDRYQDATEALLREVLAIQDAGDLARGDAFIAQWTNWDDSLHGRIATTLRDQQRYRYRLFTYDALGE